MFFLYVYSEEVFYVVIFYKGICDVMHFYIYITFEFFDAICVFNDDVWWLQIWLDVQLKDSQLDLLMTPTSLNGMWPSLALQILSSMSSFIFHLDIHHYSCPLGWFWVHFVDDIFILMLMLVMMLCRCILFVCAFETLCIKTVYFFCTLCGRLFWKIVPKISESMGPRVVMLFRM